MDYEQIILNIVSPLVEHQSDLRVILLEEESLHDSTYMVYCNESDVSRLIGKKGIVASAIRDVANVSAKLDNKHIRIKFEGKK